jgi:Cys-tRNA(Pro)/Cys-tRNA(Cys) deacylase
MAGKRTPAAVERAGIDHRVHEDAHDARAASYGLEAAEKLGVEPVRVFKTLVVTVDGAPHVAIVAVERASSTCAPSASARPWRRPTS